MMLPNFPWISQYYQSSGITVHICTWEAEAAVKFEAIQHTFWATQQGPISKRKEVFHLLKLIT